MKTFPAGLDTLLATGSYVFADLYEFTLTDGTILRYTTCDTDMKVSGVIYTSKGPFFDQISSQARGHWKRGLDLDSWMVTVMPAAVDPYTGASFPAKIRGQPWLAAVRGGALNGAIVSVHRGYLAAWPSPWSSPITPTYVLSNLFVGRVAAVDTDRTKAIITINSYVEMFSRTMPRAISQAGCRHTLFDSGCAIGEGPFQSTGNVTVLSTLAQFFTNLPHAAGYFSLGRLTFLNGNNTGFSRGVRNYFGPGSSGFIQLIAPFPFAIVVGDLFIVRAGCDKTFETCRDKFGNAANFGGQRFIPVPETAL